MPLRQPLLLAANADGLLGTASLARIRLRSLAADRQVASVAHPAIRADLDQSLDVQRDLAAQVTLDLVAPVDELAQPVDLLFGQVATSTRFSRGMSTPAIRAIGYPCRCLCLGLVQMTITVPRRRMTLQLSQRALTEALTFNGSSIT
jgi:hypothetical protein